MMSSRARRIGVAIGVAVAVITMAVTAIGCGGGGGSGDPNRFTIRANQLCRTARQEVALAERRYRAAFYEGDPTPLARSLFNAVGKLQLRLNRMKVSHEQLRPQIELHEAIFEWEFPLVSLIHLSTGQRHLVEVKSRELDATNAYVHEIASSQGVDECERLGMNMPPLPS